jgi:heme exporter protein CcmD
MTADPKFAFVFAAYLVAFAVIAGMIVATLADYASLKKQLERLTARASHAPGDGRK